MVDGIKKFVVFPPATENMYPQETGLRHFSQVDMDNWDKVKFPLFPMDKAIGKK
jgi:hypothetical protein